MMPLDVLVKIFLQIESRSDMLSFLLTCKYFNRITERYDLWLGLYERFEESIPPDAPRPDLKTLSFAFKSNFHTITLLGVQSINIAELQKPNKKYHEEILGMFQIYGIERGGGVETEGGLVIAHRGGFLPNTTCISSSHLESSIDNYCVAIHQTGRLYISTKNSRRNLVEHTFAKDNILPVFLDFIEWLQQFFEFDEIKICHEYDVEIILFKAKVKPGASIEGVHIGDNCVIGNYIRLIIGTHRDPKTLTLDHTRPHKINFYLGNDLYSDDIHIDLSAYKSIF